MLMFLGILFAAGAIVAFVFGGFAAGMSTTGTAPNPLKWPAGISAVLAVVCFVARHYLHGKSISW